MSDEYNRIRWLVALFKATPSRDRSMDYKYSVIANGLRKITPPALNGLTVEEIIEKGKKMIRKEVDNAPT